MALSRGHQILQNSFYKRSKQTNFNPRTKYFIEDKRNAIDKVIGKKAKRAGLSEGNLQAHNETIGTQSSYGSTLHWLEDVRVQTNTKGLYFVREIMLC